MAGKDHVDYYYVRWSAWAEIGDQKVDIAGFSASYGLDKIPEASIIPAVGQEPRSRKEAQAVAILQEATPYSPMRIFVKGETDMDGPRGPERPGFLYNQAMKVFDGYYMGTGYRSQRSPAGGSVQITGTLSHWLTGLTGSSSKTVANAVKGPGGFGELANIGNKGFALFDVKGMVAAGPGAAQADLWLEFIKPLCYEIMATPTVWGENDNRSALSALNRMDDPNIFAQDRGADNALPIRVEARSGDIPDYMVSEWFGAAVGEVFFKTWQSSNFWDALVTLAKQFGFAIVPLIDTATCAPVFGGLAGTPYCFVEVDEYDDCWLDARTPAMISKLVLFGNVESISSAYAAEPRISAIVGLASIEELWAQQPDAPRGVTIIERAPDWLSAEASVGVLTRESLGGDKGMIPDAVNPDANAEAPDEDYQRVFNNYLTSDLGDRYAQARLLTYALGYRRGYISGRFRLDIAPGSTIGITVICDRFSRWNTTPVAMFALVTDVELEMNAGSAGGTGYARTKLTLECLRTQSEHDSHILTRDVHPVFERCFRGSYLWG